MVLIYLKTCFYFANLIIFSDNIQLTAEAKDCKEIKASDPNAPSGIYRIKTTKGQLEIFCENDEDGGGWTVSN